MEDSDWIAEAWTIQTHMYDAVVSRGAGRRVHVKRYNVFFIVAQAANGCKKIQARIRERTDA